MEEQQRRTAEQGAVNTTTGTTLPNTTSRGILGEEEEEEEEEEDFYECQEAPGQEEEDGSKKEEEESKQEEEESKQEPAGGHLGASSRTHMSNREEEVSGGEEEEVAGGREEKEVAGGGEEEEEVEEEEEGGGGGGGEEEEVAEGDSDLELKEEVQNAPEFDDEKLREEEKDLTEEEKETRRQKSLVLKEEGNAFFKSGEHMEAELRYTAALGACPVCFSRERAVLFSNRAAACLYLDRKEHAIADCSKAVELAPGYVKALLRRAQLYEDTERLEDALLDYQKVLETEPDHQGAHRACMRLPQQIQEKNERLKEEMMGKLKDLGNMFLRPFGLSTNNFQVNQDQAGGYSVNFINNNNNNTQRHGNPP